MLQLKIHGGFLEPLNVKLSWVSCLPSREVRDVGRSVALILFGGCFFLFKKKKKILGFFCSKECQEHRVQLLVWLGVG